VNRAGYTVLGWVVWQIVSRILKSKARNNRAKLGAAAVVVAVLAGGVAASKAVSDS
jgi:hypothetical protein